MRKIVALLTVIVMAFCLAGCSSGGVPQEEYDKVVAERDALKEQIASMSVDQNEPTEQVKAQEPVPTQNIPAKTGSFDAKDAVEKLEISEYHFSSKYSNYAFLTIKNGSDYNLDISVSAKFYDSDGNLVGAKSADQDAVESGYDTILYFMPDETYESMKYEIDVSETKYWNCVQSDLSYEADEAKNKVILSVTNNGTEAADFVEAYVLFFSRDEPVSFTQNYVVDDDSELKPGKTISKEMDCYEEFDSYRIFLSGRR